ncbi:hypothetical protein [Armatimonas rosea]|uniref:Uncharacterized protein n=1 Tax=Armatimonas rosea TaxID=685828 RepID=A0A7W9SRG5_ARMRO|nr:hypothetical protein [Armatimonas rosea]MBB6050698.1 hypothetical protein [Armatimonas rosea]
MSRFLEHWFAVNAALAPDALTLRGGYDVAALAADRTTFEANAQAVTQSMNRSETAISRRKALRASLRERLRSFRATVLADFAETEFAAALPLIPSMTANDSLWEQTIHDMADLWARLNAASLPDFTPPLTLQGGYTHAELVAETAALVAATHDAKEAPQASTTLRKTRDTHLKTVQANLVRYRKAVTARFLQDHALILSLPNL